MTFTTPGSAHKGNGGALTRSQAPFGAISGAATRGQNSRSVIGSWSDPPKRGVEQLLASYAVSPYFQSIVAKIAQTFAAVEWYEPGPNNTRLTQTPVVRAINRYNDDMIGTAGRQLEQVYSDVVGEFITIMAPGKDGRAFELFPVPPPQVTVESTAGVKEYVVWTGAQPFVFPAEQVLHARTNNPLDPYGRGLGPGWALADEIETDEYAAKHVKAYYYNSGVPEFIGVLQGMSDTQLEKWEKDWDDKHRGFRRHYRPAWVSRLVDIKELTRRMGHREIERLRRHIFKTIKVVYGVPPEIVGDVENSNRATALAAIEIMARLVTLPRLVARREFWSDRFGVDLQFVSPIPQDFGRRDQIMERHAFHFTRNEVRQEAGFAPVPVEENVFMVPVNMEPVAATPLPEGGAVRALARLTSDGRVAKLPKIRLIRSASHGPTVVDAVAEPV